jgi:ATP-dependent Clp protease ATP-binding subunit ClpA
MSEFMENSRFKTYWFSSWIVGYDDGGQLTAVRRKPYSVVLFDEVESSS